MRLHVLLSLWALAACQGSTMARGTPLAKRERPAPQVREPDYWPTRGWRHSTPEEQGFRSGALAEALLAASRDSIAIHSLVIVRNGRVVLDAVFYPFPRGERHDVASVTKSVTSVLLGVAAGKRLLSPSDRLSTWLPLPSDRDQRLDRVTLEHLVAMQSGFDCGFGRGERELAAMQRNKVWVDFALRLPMRSEPGSEFGYCSSNYQLVSSAIAKSAGVSLAEFAQRELFLPVGISDFHWPADSQGVTHGWGNLQLMPRDMAKFGFLLLHGGRWEEQQLVPREWVIRSTTPRIRYGDRNLYGIGWWSHPDSPPGFFEAIGRGGQRVSVWPEKNLVVVMTGGGYEPGTVGGLLLGALVSDSALPPEPDAYARLQTAIDRVAGPPPAFAASRSPLEKTVTGRSWVLEDNPLRFRRARFLFESDDHAAARFEIGEHILELPIGMDGRYRIAPTAIERVRPGTRATWKAANRLVVELDLIGKIDHYLLDFDFHEDVVTVSIVERTGLVREVVRGRAVP